MANSSKEDLQQSRRSSFIWKYNNIISNFDKTVLQATCCIFVPRYHLGRTNAANREVGCNPGLRTSTYTKELRRFLEFVNVYAKFAQNYGATLISDSKRNSLEMFQKLTIRLWVDLADICENHHVRASWSGHPYTLTTHESKHVHGAALSQKDENEQKEVIILGCGSKPNADGRSATCDASPSRKMEKDHRTPDTT